MQPFYSAEKNQTRSCCFGPKVNSSGVLTTGLGVGVGVGAGGQAGVCVSSARWRSLLTL